MATSIVWTTLLVWLFRPLWMLWRKPRIQMSLIIMAQTRNTQVITAKMTTRLLESLKQRSRGRWMRMNFCTHPVTSRMKIMMNFSRQFCQTSMNGALWKSCILMCLYISDENFHSSVSLLRRYVHHRSVGKYSAWLPKIYIRISVHHQNIKSQSWWLYENIITRWNYTHAMIQHALLLWKVNPCKFWAQWYSNGKSE